MNPLTAVPDADDGCALNDEQAKLVRGILKRQAALNGQLANLVMQQRALEQQIATTSQELQQTCNIIAGSYGLTQGTLDPDTMKIRRQP